MSRYTSGGYNRGPLFEAGTDMKREVWYSLQEAGYVLLAAGGPGEGRGVIFELPGHDEGMFTIQLTVISLTVMMDSKTERDNLCYILYTVHFSHICCPDTFAHAHT